METKELHKMVGVTTVALVGDCTTIFLSLKGFAPIKIRVSHMSWDVKRTMEVEVWNEETKKWEIRLGADAFEYEEVKEALRDKGLAGLFAQRVSEVFEHVGNRDFFDLLKEEGMIEYIDSRIDYYKFEFKEDK